uniref:ATP synthase CF1 delta subunit n=1 Tax=Apophlaea sinclairii TaxID=212746 RepID=A0A1C9CBI2_9FLOR|nr:ATP synthase CF1 delta subunit [Apophlaea sinclairii]AOM65736.1 ATP synthase CF1 delta subunit [Apophlaea sinclairii]
MNNVVSLPYAEAIIDLANMQDQILNITKDLINISELLSQSEYLQRFLISPVIYKQSKKVAINQLLNGQVNCITMKFLYVLIDKNRIMLFDNILRCYLELLNKLELTIVVYLRTAKALTTTQYKLLESQVKKITNAQTIKIETVIDTNLIGGFILQIGSKIIDTSLLGQLRKMASHLNTANALT